MNSRSRLSSANWDFMGTASQTPPVATRKPQARLPTVHVILAALLSVMPGGLHAQAPCTDQQARERVGSLMLSRENQALLDSERRSRPEPAVLEKINEAIAILKQALPAMKGVEGTYSYDVYRLPPNGRAMRFSIRVGLFAYWCAPMRYPANVAGKVSREDETGTWIIVDFNSLGTLTGGGSSLSKEIRTPEGQLIYELPRESEYKGHRLFIPDKFGRESNVIVLTAGGLSPFTPVTRNDFLLAREKMYQGYIDKVPAGVNKGYRDELDSVKRFHATLSPDELAEQAVIRNANQSPARGKVFVGESEHGLRLVTIDHSYINRNLPPTAIQLITLEWQNSDHNAEKHEAIRQFEANLDVEALSRLLDR